jgi:hypothetical protein
VVAQRVQFLGGLTEERGSQPDEPPPPTDADAAFDQGFSDEEIPF